MEETNKHWKKSQGLRNPTMSQEDGEPEVEYYSDSFSNPNNSLKKLPLKLDSSNLKSNNYTSARNKTGSRNPHIDDDIVMTSNRDLSGSGNTVSNPMIYG